jgi:hypothetical protein
LLGVGVLAGLPRLLHQRLQGPVDCDSVPDSGSRHISPGSGEAIVDSQSKTSHFQSTDQVAVRPCREVSGPSTSQGRVRLQHAS